jgi:hypothetical protein
MAVPKNPLVVKLLLVISNKDEVYLLSSKQLHLETISPNPTGVEGYLGSAVQVRFLHELLLRSGTDRKKYEFNPSLDVGVKRQSTFLCTLRVVKYYNGP